MQREAILLAVDGLPIGGTERQIVALLGGLQQSGRFAVTLALLDHGGALEPEAAHAAAGVVPLGRKARFDCTPALFLAWQARRARVRLIHAVGWMSGLAGLLAARSLRLPIINGTIRQTPVAMGVRDRISRWCACRSDWIVANSFAGLRAYGLAEHPRAQVIVNGIDLRRCDGVVPQAADQPTICMVANFSALKDQATVIRALPEIRQAVPGVRLLLVGNDRGTLAAARRLADELCVSEAVRFMSNTVHPEPFIAGSQVCVLASPSESFCNAILEYMALGKPVVATATCGDTAALIRDGGAGFLVPPNSPHCVAARVIELLRDPERAHQMGQAGRRHVQLLTVPRMVAEYEALYQRLLEPPTPAAPGRADRQATPCAS
jgi:glycosyltransferase involved in cell wall biosynthesis